MEKSPPGEFYFAQETQRELLPTKILSIHAQVIKWMEAAGHTISVPEAVPKRRDTGLKLSPMQSYVLKGAIRQQNRRQIPRGSWFQATETDTSQGKNLFTG